MATPSYIFRGRKLWSTCSPPSVSGRTQGRNQVDLACRHVRRNRRRRAKMVITMDRLPPQHPVNDPPNLVRAGSFSLDRLLSHIDPGPAEESEAFVRLIYEQRHI